MWQKLSLRARINLLLAVTLTLGLAINIGRLVIEAGPRVAAEDQSVVRLAGAFTATMVAGLNNAADPDAKLRQIVDELNGLRHLRIGLQNAGMFGNPKTADAGKRNSPPGWFVSLVHPEHVSATIPISMQGRSATLIVTSLPDDEIAEIWDGIVTQLEIGSIVVLVLLAVTMLVVGRALAPLEQLSQTMAKIQAGSYGARVTPAGAPELAAICTRLNHLAAALGEAVEDKRRLAERAVSLQDTERKEIARELHDEFGPYLFSLRAHASALARLSDARDAPQQSLRRHSQAMLEQVNALQQFNRRVLDRLRPAALAELGLKQAVEALVRLWRESSPEIRVETMVSPELGQVGETADLTIYRVVQEALTNVFRHSGATTVDVRVEAVQHGLGTDAARRWARVRIGDNGRGMDASQKLGFGLLGMRERILALGGSLSVASNGAGLTVEALIPTGHV